MSHDPTRARFAEALNQLVEEVGRDMVTRGDLDYTARWVVVTGTPEDIARCRASYTGQFLKTRLGGSTRA